MDALTRTWLLLLGLTLATALLAGIDGRLAALALLALAWLKARAILGGFLHLRAAPGWLGAAMLPLGIWLAAIGALCLVALG
ncbi:MULTISPECIES: cytochrome C oxidase subunit IV family protein [Paracoccus]|uniref:cytochrome C oxidase subunit IV family protein n=1 Tax=Paracoccus TaxID=265 RepID=UPI00078393B1|nr:MULTISPECIES: cytochrome C oxidase subunit IV family protein [Paracoccus]MCV2449133.1 cytochrome C oxidase subunit IV family protein [Paracoccus sp. DMF]MDQ7774759.1 cytochrome C oxidase subunit IV family protein [Paracoccus aminovorans]